MFFVENLNSTDLFIGIDVPDIYENDDGFTIKVRDTIYTDKVTSLGGSMTTWSFNTNDIDKNLTKWIPYLTGCEADVFDIIKNKKAFTNKGLIEGNISTDNIVENYFIDMTSDIYSQVQTKIDSMNNPIILGDDEASKRFLSSCYFLPIKSSGELMVDFTNVTSNNYSFAGNPNIRCLPDLNLSSYNSVWMLFQYCTNLQTVGNIVINNQINKLTDLFEGCDIRKISSVTAVNAVDFAGTFASNPNLTSEGLPVLNIKEILSGSAMFRGCKSLEAIRDDYDFTNIYSCSEMFRDCSNFTNIPNTMTLQNCNYIANAFRNCSSLIDLPVFNFSKIGTGSTKNNSVITGFVSGCNNLSNQSLENLMYSATTVSSSYNGTKSLSVFGITRNQANICYNLPNYSVLTSGGWNLGYNNH
jgi:hypothetical protein